MYAESTAEVISGWESYFRPISMSFQYSYMNNNSFVVNLDVRYNTKGVLRYRSNNNEVAYNTPVPGIYWVEFDRTARYDITKYVSTPVAGQIYSTYNPLDSTYYIQANGGGLGDYVYFYVFGSVNSSSGGIYKIDYEAKWF